MASWTNVYLYLKVPECVKHYHVRHNDDNPSKAKLNLGMDALCYVTAD